VPQVRCEHERRCTRGYYRRIPVNPAAPRRTAAGGLAAHAAAGLIGFGRRDPETRRSHLGHVAVSARRTFRLHAAAAYCARSTACQLYCAVRRLRSSPACRTAAS
jgi:hypothetical protein